MKKSEAIHLIKDLTEPQQIIDVLLAAGMLPPPYQKVITTTRRIDVGGMSLMNLDEQHIVEVREWEEE